MSESRWDRLSWQERHKRLERMQVITWVLIGVTAVLLYLAVAIAVVLS